jgi:Na+/H+ antiporter NhaB
MKNAKKILKKNLTESISVAAKIFSVNRRSLSAFIQRDSDAKNEEQNKMLQNHKKNVFDNFIRSLLKHEILFINEIVFSAIMRLKRAHHFKTSSKK